MSLTPSNSDQHTHQTKSEFQLQPNWTNSKKNYLYLEISKNKLSNLETLSLPENGSFNLNDIINQRFLNINSTLIDSTKEVDVFPKKN